MSKLKAKILSGACLVLSVIITYLVFNYGLNRAMSGESALIWLHVGAFIVSVGLVVMAIVLPYKIRG